MFEINNSEVIFKNKNFNSDIKLQPFLIKAISIYEISTRIKKIKFVNCKFDKNNLITFNTNSSKKITFEFNECTNQNIIFKNCMLINTTLEVLTDTKIEFKNIEAKFINIILTDNIERIKINLLKINSLNINSLGKKYFQVSNLILYQNNSNSFNKFSISIKQVIIEELEFNLDVQNNNILKFVNCYFISDKYKSIRLNEYGSLKVFFDNIEFDNKSFLELHNLCIENSNFKNLNFSKFKLNNSTIQKSKVINCSLDEESDFDTKQVFLIFFIFMFLSAIFNRLLQSTLLNLNEIPNDIKTEILKASGFAIGTVDGMLALSLVLTIPFLFFHHKKIADEYINFTLLDLLYLKVIFPIYLNLYSIIKFFKINIKKPKLPHNFKNTSDVNEYYVQLEEKYKMLKKLFLENNNLSLTSELLYSEHLMKLKRYTFVYNLVKSIIFLIKKDIDNSKLYFKRNIWLNLDFYSYFLSGFNRRWQRSLLMFLTSTIFLITVVVNDKDFIHTDEVPQFVKNINDKITIIENMKLDEILKNTPEEIPSLMLSRLYEKLKLNSIILSSRLDLFRTSSSKWFEYSNYNSFIKYNLITIIMAFLIYNLLVSLKNRLEK